VPRRSSAARATAAAPAASASNAAVNLSVTQVRLAL
jgi:hypothetical protein